ncbi:MAG: DUF504 domain-containing protein [Methanobacteriaceae archaeon]|jgi:uncharacterized protein
MAKNALNMIFWHPDRDINKCSVTYLNRGSPGNLKTIPGNTIDKIQGGFMILLDSVQIPSHRIVKIECNGKIIWRKNQLKEI